jgi:hypothetical protein
MALAIVCLNSNSNTRATVTFKTVEDFILV